MAGAEEVDPQYLWILPQYFELTDMAREPGPAGTSIFEFGTSEAYLMRLRTLASRKKLSFIGSFCGSEEEHSQQRTKYNLWKGLARLDCTFTQYIFWLETSKACRHIGIAVRGDIRRISQMTTKVGDQKPSTLPILILDPDKARKYINIGVHIGSDIPKHPKTLDETAIAYGKLCALIDGDDKTIKEIDEQIKESKDGYKIWELKREKFRLETKERYRELLVDFAQEDRLERQLKDLQNKKRARVD